MKDPRSGLIQQQAREASQRRQREALQQAKLGALQQVLGNRGVYTYLDLNDLIDPDNKNWADYTYRLPSFMVSPTESAERQGHIDSATPEGLFINSIRNAETIDDVNKQHELWNSYDPLSSHGNARKYFMFMVGGKEPDPVQATAGDAQGTQGMQAGAQAGVQGVQAGDAVVKGGTQGTQDTQGVQAGAKPGNAVAGGGVQGSNNGSGSAQAGNGTFVSGDVAKGGTKTIGYDPYDPNPGNVSLAYAMRNAPEQERRTALINEWNKEHGISYATGKDGLIYRTDPQHPNGYVDPFKNDLSKIGSTGYATGKGMLTSGSNGTYATGESIKDANGNVLTNPGGDWEYQYALRDPQYGLGMMGKMSDAQKNYLQAVSDGMGYNYNFNKGAPRYV